MKLLTIIVTAILIAGIGWWGISQYSERVALQEQLRLVAVASNQKREAERSFALSDAYKQPPELYAETREHPLYGKIAPKTESDSTFAAPNAQDLDTKLGADDLYDRKCDQAQTTKANAIAGYARTVSGIASNYPRSAEADQFNRDILQSKIANVFEPQRVAAINTATAERERTLDNLVSKHRLVPVSRDTRVQILDISGHYAKFRVIDGGLAGSLLFVSPNDLLVK